MKTLEFQGAQGALRFGPCDDLPIAKVTLHNKRGKVVTLGFLHDKQVEELAAWCAAYQAERWCEMCELDYSTATEATTTRHDFEGKIVRLCAACASEWDNAKSEERDAK